MKIMVGHLVDLFLPRQPVFELLLLFHKPGSKNADNDINMLCFLRDFCTLISDNWLLTTGYCTLILFPVVFHLLLFLLHLHLVQGADISLDAICGNKLVRIKPPPLSVTWPTFHEQVDSCPKKISLKVIGGTSSCAEKVPWNVLVEHATSTNKAAGL